jgi:hypothetical protein
LSKELDITLRLQKIEHLFDDPDISPFSEYYYSYSTKAGMEYIIEKLYEYPSTKKINLTVLLPPNQITSDLEGRTSIAINKYSDAWAQDAIYNMNRAKYKGTRGLLTAFVALIILVNASLWLSDSSNIFLKLGAEGLSVAAWVLMWYPFDYLTQELWVYRLEKKFYNALKKVCVHIKPDTVDTVPE